MAPDLAKRFRGVVDPRRQSDLAFRRSGRVSSIEVDAGDVAEAGDVLATLDTADLEARKQSADSELEIAQAQYDEALSGPRKQTIKAAEARVEQLQAQLSASTQRLDRRKNLFRAGAASVEEYQDERLLVKQLSASVGEAQSQLRELLEGTRSEQILAARAKVSMAKASRQMIDVELSDSRIVAPYDCVISQRMIDEGTIAGPNQTVISILEKPPLEARFGLPSTAAGMLRTGHEIWVSAGAGTNSNADSVTMEDVGQLDSTFKATIVRMQPGVDPVTRTREVVVAFATDNVSLVGQPATLWLPWSTLQINAAKTMEDVSSDSMPRTFWVPSDALVRGVRGLWAVYVAVPDQASDAKLEPSGPAVEASVQTRDAKVIQTAGPMTQVSARVSDSDWIVTGGTHRVGPGVLVLFQPESESVDAGEERAEQ